MTDQTVRTSAGPPEQPVLSSRVDTRRTTDITYPPVAAGDGFARRNRDHNATPNWSWLRPIAERQLSFPSIQLVNSLFTAGDLRNEVFPYVFH
jgi:hypothetical protein